MSFGLGLLGSGWERSPLSQKVYQLIRLSGMKNYETVRLLNADYLKIIPIPNCQHSLFGAHSPFSPPSVRMSERF